MQINITTTYQCVCLNRKASTYICISIFKYMHIYLHVYIYHLRTSPLLQPKPSHSFLISMIEIFHEMLYVRTLARRLLAVVITQSSQYLLKVIKIIIFSSKFIFSILSHNNNIFFFFFFFFF
jgi:hypothetical protein